MNLRTPQEKLRHHAKQVEELGGPSKCYVQALAASHAMESVADALDGKAGVWIDDHRDTIIETLLRVQHLYEQGMVDASENPKSWTSEVGSKVDELIEHLTAPAR